MYFKLENILDMQPHQKSRPANSPASEFETVPQTALEQVPAVKQVVLILARVRVDAQHWSGVEKAEDEATMKFVQKKCTGN